MVVEKPISADSPLILASGSARRRELLQRIGVPLEVVPSDAVEEFLPDEAPEDAVLRLAAAKARTPGHPGRWVLAADTVVLARGQPLGKPRDPGEAVAMLEALSGGWHRVLTGVVLVSPGGREVMAEAVGTDVKFRELSSGEIHAYVAAGEPMGKAGAYAIQGQAAAFVEELRGSYSNVVGLPLARVVGGLLVAGALGGIPFGDGTPSLEPGGRRGRSGG